MDGENTGAPTPEGEETTPAPETEGQPTPEPSAEPASGELAGE